MAGQEYVYCGNEIYNTSALSNSNQSQSAIGSFSNFAFTFQQDRNGEQTSTWKSSITDAAAGTGSSSNAIQSKTSVSHVSMAGQNSNGMAILSNISVYQLTIDYSADHGSDYGPGVASTGNTRFLSRDCFKTGLALCC